MDGTRGSAATGCVRRTLAGIGFLPDILADVSSWASGVAAIGSSNADLLVTKTGIRVGIRLPGKATGLPHKVELNSGMATTAETGGETGIVEDDANQQGKGSLVWFRSHQRPFYGPMFFRSQPSEAADKGY